ncbi:MAG: hypothetical protein C4521_11660 [Actinobacteria bacterium]|nr:MAG: hypothetical protein C4521_11660 [Actinomycetota bacterium]
MHDAHAHQEHEEEPSPSDVLESEHRVIERVLDLMDRAADQIDGGRLPPLSVFLNITDFIAGFADADHHGKEEWKMFPMLAEEGMPTDHGPMKQLIADHARGRELNGQMRHATERLRHGEAKADADLLRAMREYVKLLHVHIKKEDNMFFPMADRMLDEAHQRQLSEQFDEVEADQMGETGRIRYLRMLADIEEELG